MNIIFAHANSFEPGSIHVNFYKISPNVHYIEIIDIRLQIVYSSNFHHIRPATFNFLTLNQKFMVCSGFIFNCELEKSDFQ